MKWVVVAVPLVLLALFPLLVLFADRMRPNRPARPLKVRPARTRPIAAPAAAPPASPAPELSNLERARQAWAEIVAQQSGHEPVDH